jgi:hypothetical protein
MQSSSTTWIEIGVSAVGLIGLLVLLAPALGRGPKRSEDGWLFPVKLTCLLARWIGLALGVGAVAYAGHTLLASTIANWGAWASFAFGFVLVPLVLSHWPEPVVFDRAGLWKRGNPMSRIRWEELAYVRQYDIRNDRGIVIHSVYGKQLVVDEISYGSAQLLDKLMELHPVPLHTNGEDHVLSILKTPLPRVPVPRRLERENGIHEIPVSSPLQRPE